MKSFICSKCGVDMYDDVMKGNYVNVDGVLFCGDDCATNKIPLGKRKIGMLTSYTRSKQRRPKASIERK